MKRIQYIIALVLILGSSISQAQTVQELLKEKVNTQISQMITPEPNTEDPVQLNAELIWSKDKSQFALVLKYNILSNWHIYAFVPPSQPYIQTELNIDHSDKLVPIGKWQKPGFSPYDGGVHVYKGQQAFVRYFSVIKKIKKGEKISCGLYYQACDAYQCHPPKKKEFAFTL